MVPKVRKFEVNFMKTWRRTLRSQEHIFMPREERASPGARNYRKKWENMCIGLFTLFSRIVLHLFSAVFQICIYIHIYFFVKIYRHIIVSIKRKNHVLTLKIFFFREQNDIDGNETFAFNFNRVLSYQSFGWKLISSNYI